MSHPEPAGIDPLGPRFGATITSVLLIATAVVGFAGASVAAWWMLAVIAALFAWGAFAGIRHHPYGLLFAKLVRPRLGASAELEDPRPPTFAQGVGFAVTAIGLVVGAFGAPLAAPIAASVAFVAAFLNAAFDFCLGCRMYLLLARARLVARS